MKLIECYIENFGRLASYTHTFSDGLNVIIGKNGCGKTTLTVFIKSMLYGMEAKKTKGEESDRKRYLPWQGGRCGGSLTFENEGKQYRIERTFGDKPSSDTFAIYDTETGSLSSDFSENVGEELFDIDADGFERTVFLSERKLSVSGNNQTISAKLSNLVGVDGDMGSLDGALDELEKKEKYYRHRRGKGGLIGDIKSDISELDIELLDINRKKGVCEGAERELSEITDKISSAEKQKVSLEGLRLSDTYKKEHQAKMATVTALEKSFEKDKSFFAAHLPSSDEIRSYEQKRGQALLLEKSIKEKRNLLSQNFVDKREEIDKQISALDSLETHKKANISCQICLFFALTALVLGIVLGTAVTPALYILAAVSLPFFYLGAKSLKKAYPSKSRENVLKEIADFAASDAASTPEQLRTILLNMKAENFAEVKERERTLDLINKDEEILGAITIEYEAFLSKFNLSSEDKFGELRSRLNAYENSLERIAFLKRDAALYAEEHGISGSAAENTAISEEEIKNVDAELRSLRSVRYMLESRLSSLYDELSREDELKERRLELTDALEDAEATHKTILKATEHLISAKERLTSKYLGKMREAFNFYIERIGAEDGKTFTLATDFSLTKTENGLTNSIGSYSLGTKELYSLATRLALIDALYEKNHPFIVLDDPFCHFDDKKCEAALAAIKKIARDKQIIYITCTEARTPD